MIELLNYIFSPFLLWLLLEALAMSCNKQNKEQEYWNQKYNDNEL